MLGCLGVVSCSGENHDKHSGAPPAGSNELASPVSFDALYVVNGADDSISVINTESGEVAGIELLDDADYSTCFSRFDTYLATKSLGGRIVACSYANSPIFRHSLRRF